jgi:hypothetical protein
MATADALAATLKKPVDAHRWLARGAQLADLIAKEDRSLQLYRLITRFVLLLYCILHTAYVLAASSLFQQTTLTSVLYVHVQPTARI